MPRLLPSAALVVLLLAAGCSAGQPSTAAPPAATTPPAAAMGQMAMPMSGSMPVSGAGRVAHAPSRLVDPATFAAAVSRPGTVTIDVHIAFEGKIAGTDLMIPYTEVAQQARQLPANHATQLAIYCRSGNMSAIAAPELAALGYTDIVELQGGMDAWRASGRTLLTTP